MWSTLAPSFVHFATLQQLLLSAIRGSLVSSAGRCALTLLLQALRELGGVLSAVDVPQGVKDAFPSLSDLQTQLFTTVPIPEFASGAPDKVMRLEPTDLLLEMVVN